MRLELENPHPYAVYTGLRTIVLAYPSDSHTAWAGDAFLCLLDGRTGYTILDDRSYDERSHLVQVAERIDALGEVEAATLRSFLGGHDYRRGSSFLVDLAEAVVA